MKKLQYVVENKNTLVLKEAGAIGDCIDLSDQISVDTAAIEAEIEKKTQEAKEKYYKTQLEAEIKAVKAMAEKEKADAVSELTAKLEKLNGELNSVKALGEQALKNKDEEKAHALEKNALELSKEYEKKLAELKKLIDASVQEKALALQKQASQNQDALALKDKEIAKKEQEILSLESKLDGAAQAEKLAVNNAEKAKDAEIAKLTQKLAASGQDLELALAKADSIKKDELSKKDLEIAQLNQTIQEIDRRKADELRAQKERYESEIKMKDETIEQYKDFKIRMSTKMVGESLEQHCLNEFNKVRAYAFPNAYFGKDNDSATTGSKGDFIYRETDGNGVEILSIMFEMKNEMDTTASKHKNEHFFKELDKDRNEKHCEYAVLVSMLESDNDYYNTGIVDVSYQYQKMYVVRPHMFLTLIGLLRQASLNAYQYKVELKEAKEANIDITNFEGKLNKFKDDFTGHYASATKNHEDAIAEIDKAIKNLEAVKASLQKSDKYLDLCNKDMDKVTIKKLTYGNPTMKKLLEDAKEE